jgi:SecD/SecF fusion protein
MNKVSGFRIGLVAAVTLISLVLFIPSARYFLALRAELSDDPQIRQQQEERLDTLRQRAIPLGLDLRGGVDVTLQIDEEKTVEQAVSAMATRLNNEFTNKNISAQAEPVEDSSDIRVRVLDRAEARNAYNVLANYREEITGDFSQELLESGPVLIGLDRAQLEEALERDIRGAEKVVRERLDKFGLAQPSITIQGRKQIRIQVAGERDPDRLIENITRLAQMEFRLTHELSGTGDDPLRGLLDENGELRPDAVVPLGHEVLPYEFGQFDPNTGQVVYDRGYIVVEREVRLTGENLRSAGVFRDQFDLENPIKVSMQFDRTGTDIFTNLTRESVDSQRQGGRYRQLAIILDGVVRSAPQMAVVIAGGSAVIEGGFTFEEANDLSLLLKAGSLNAPLEVESKQAVGATLGTESIIAGVEALAIGSFAIILFMAFYYGAAGLVSIFALTLNVLMILAALALADATLTLSGIGGILLTVGMAVDANVLIYERMREEIDSGRSLKQAIAVGFDRAYAVILDSNLTTLMTALVLLQFTEGSVRGFALTMSFGIIANLFTGLTVTRTLCELWFQRRGTLSLGRLRPFDKTAFDFIKLRFGSWAFSLLLLGSGIVMVFANDGLRFGVDFSGGLLTEIRFTEPTNEAALREMIRTAGLQGERVQSVPGTPDYIIRVKMLEEADPHGDLAPSLPLTEAALNAGLTTTFGEGGFEIMRAVSFGPETGQGFRRMAVQVVFLASLVILLYLWFRFEFVFGAAAVAALVHDMLIVILWASLWNVEITLDVVAALMVMLGFSVNDTIVIFDRIRENVKKSPDKAFGEICNLSMNQSLSRTLITSGTVVLVILAMLFLGGEGLRPFAKILLLGALVGTYSSDFVAAPIVYQWNKFRKGGAVARLREKDKPSGPEKARAPQSRTGRASGKLPKTRAV